MHKCFCAALVSVYLLTGCGLDMSNEQIAKTNYWRERQDSIWPEDNFKLVLSDGTSYEYLAGNVVMSMSAENETCRLARYDGTYYMSDSLENAWYILDSETGNAIFDNAMFSPSVIHPGIQSGLVFVETQDDGLDVCKMGNMTILLSPDTGKVISRYSDGLIVDITVVDDYLLDPAAFEAAVIPTDEVADAIHTKILYIVEMIG